MVMLRRESVNTFHTECMRHLVFTGGRVGRFIILSFVGLLILSPNPVSQFSPEHQDFQRLFVLCVCGKV